MVFETVYYTEDGGSRFLQNTGKFQIITFSWLHNSEPKTCTKLSVSFVTQKETFLIWNCHTKTLIVINQSVMRLELTILTAIMKRGKISLESLTDLVLIKRLIIIIIIIRVHLIQYSKLKADAQDCKWLQCKT